MKKILTLGALFISLIITITLWLVVLMRDAEINKEDSPVVETKVETVIEYKEVPRATEYCFVSEDGNWLMCRLPK